MKRSVLLAASLAVLVTAPRGTRGDAAGRPAAQPIVAFLDEAIAWYRQQGAQARLATDPADVVFLDAARQQARQVIQLAFAFARAAATLEPRQETQAAPAATGHLNIESVSRMAADAASDVERAQTSADALRRQLAAATTRRKRTLLKEQLAEVRSELALAQARRQNLTSFLDFLKQAGSGTTGGAGLQEQIEELQRSVPDAETATTAATSTQAATATSARRATPSGIIALTGDVLALGRKVRALREGSRHTTALRAAIDKIRAPLAADLRATLQRGDQLSDAADSTDEGVLAQRTRDLGQITSHFKAISSAVIPLGKAGVLLDAHRATLDEWRATTDDQYDADLRALALHVALLVLAIAAILVASAFWRRATFRYVRDPRRRHQSLLLRRVVVAAVIALMIAFSFVTEVGSLATFAGFITAGLAVALQNVILSVAAYFFLIGRYGVRIGDRIQVSGVTGDVMDIGLVRLHVMELGADGLPTGRVVAFSNAVLFQPASNFFKQIPGSNFAWHQVTLTMSPDTDYRYAEQRVMDAVAGVYAQYHDGIAKQHEAMSQDMALTLHEPRPQSLLRLTQAGLEMTIRFPVPLDIAPAVDDQMTRGLLDAVAREPRLKLVGAGPPTIQATPEASGA